MTEERKRPDFIVDPYGNVQDSRLRRYEFADTPANRPPGDGKGSMRKSLSSKKPAGEVLLIPIPIGLIIFLVMLLIRAIDPLCKSDDIFCSELAHDSFQRGNFHYFRGDYDLALKQFSRALQAEPEKGIVLNSRGLAYQAIGEHDKALVDFQKALELVSKPAMVYNNRALTHLALGDLDKAMADLDEAIELWPNLGKAYHNRGLALYALGDYDGAITNLTKAIEYSYSSPPRLSTEDSLRIDTLMQGVFDQSRAQSASADVPSVHFHRALVYLEMGQPDLAIADLQRTLELGLDPRVGHEVTRGNRLTTDPARTLGLDLDSRTAQEIEALLAKIVFEPMPGPWQGKPNLGRNSGTISFDVGNDGHIYHFRLELELGPNDLCTVSSDEIIVEPDRTFSLIYGSMRSEGQSSIQGQFTSATTTTGILSRIIQCEDASGQKIPLPLPQGTTWSATWSGGRGARFYDEGKELTGVVVTSKGP